MYFSAMRLMHKILAFVSMTALLVSTMGYTIEHHFCNHCERNFETAWFLIPTAEDMDHACDCSHDEAEETDVCTANCKVDRAVHVEHVRAEIQSFLIQNDNSKILNLLSQLLAVSGNTIPNNSDSEQLFEYSPYIYQWPSGLISTHIAHCVFRL